jgi:hypothetical protein
MDLICGAHMSGPPIATHRRKLADKHHGLQEWGDIGLLAAEEWEVVNMDEAAVRLVQ